MSGPEQEAKPAAANAPATTDQPRAVDTFWYVDYHQLAGNYAHSPYRMGDDQLVVEHLKLMPDSDGAKILHGGNAASSGQVLLGEAEILATTGQVSAAIRYAKRSSFKLDVTLDGKSNAADAKQLNAVRAEMREKLDEMLLTRGDYDGLRAELEATYADRFPDRKLSVKLQPIGAGKASSTLFSASAGAYDASRASKFLVTIDPGQAQSHETSYSQSTVEDHGTATHDSSSVSSTNDSTTHESKETVDEVVDQFERAYQRNVQRTFDEIAKAVSTSSEVKESDLSRNVTWKLGLNPKQDEKKGDDKEPKSSPGIASKIWGIVKTGAKYAVKAGGKLLKLGKAAFDLTAGLLDVINGRGWFERDSSDGSGSKDTRANGLESSDTYEAKNVDTVGEDLKTQFNSSHKTDLKSELTTHLQLSATKGSGNDVSDKTTTTKTVSGSTTTHELGDLAVVVKAKE